MCISTHTCCIRLSTLIPHALHLPCTPEERREGAETTLGLIHVAPTHLCFMNIQHICFGLVVKPKSEMDFVKEILGWAGVALDEAMWMLWTPAGG